MVSRFSEESPECLPILSLGAADSKSSFRICVCFNSANSGRAKTDMSARKIVLFIIYTRRWNFTIMARTENGVNRFWQRIFASGLAFCAEEIRTGKIRLRGRRPFRGTKKLPRREGKFLSTLQMPHVCGEDVGREHCDLLQTASPYNRRVLETFGRNACKICVPGEPVPLLSRQMKSCLI